MQQVSTAQLIAGQWANVNKLVKQDTRTGSTSPRGSRTFYLVQRPNISKSIGRRRFLISIASGVSVLGEPGLGTRQEAT